MLKSEKFLIFLLVILVAALASYLILTSRPAKQTAPESQTVKPENIILSDDSYKASVKDILAAYEKLSADNSFTAGKLAELKDKLLSLKGFQSKFQKLHVNFVLAIDRMEDYLASRDEKQKLVSQQIIDRLKADYNWLTN